MIEILNPLGDIEYIINRFLSIIEFFSKYRTNEEINSIRKIQEKNSQEKNLEIRLQYLNYISEIFKINKIIESTSDKELEEFFLTNSLYDKIITKKELSKSEIRQQFKNCLAHANILMFYDINSKLDYTELYIGNEMIECRIPNYYIWGLLMKLSPREYAEEYITYIKKNEFLIKDEDDIRKFINGIMYLSYEKTKKESEKQKVKMDKEVIRIIKSMKFSNIAEKIKETLLMLNENDVTIHLRKFKLSEIQLKKLISFIKLIGIDKFNKLDFLSKTGIIRYLFYNKYVEFPQHNTFVAQILTDTGDTKEFKFDDVELLSFPIHYCNAIEELLTYTMLYLREINEKIDTPVKLKDFNYSGIKCSNGIDLYDYLLDKKIIKYIDPLAGLRLKIINLQNNLSKLNKEIDRKKEILMQINNSQRQKTEGAIEAKRKECEEFIKYNELEIEKIEREIKSSQSELSTKESNPEYRPYLNSRDFFRHIRNSISHGRINYDFSNVANDDFSKTILTFTDQEKNDKDYFELSISCADLIVLIKNYSKAFISELPSESLVSLFFYSSTSKTKKTIKTHSERVKEITILPIQEIAKNRIIHSICGDSKLIRGKDKISYIDVIKATYKSKMKSIKEKILLRKYYCKRFIELTDEIDQRKKTGKKVKYDITAIGRQIFKEWNDINQANFDQEVLKSKR